MSKLKAWVIGAEFIDDLIRHEIADAGLEVLQQRGSVIQVEGQLAQLYHFMLWSRLASTVLLELLVKPVASLDELYQACRQFPWSEHLASRGSFKIRFNGELPGLNDERYATLLIKDAVVDSFRETCGERPDVIKDRPDLVIDARIRGEDLYLCLDLAGEGLHRRGYRIQGGPAPLKETLASAVLLRAKWPERAAQGATLMDPLCGSGTLLAEAWMMATQFAPGLMRDYWGFSRWLGHDQACWQQLLQKARAQHQQGLEQPPALMGRDINRGAVIATERHLRALGAPIGGISLGSVEEWDDAVCPGALVVTNPPYGERLGQDQDLMALYHCLGVQAHRFAAGGQLVVLSSELGLLKRIALAPTKQHRLRNGALEVLLQHFDLAQPQRELQAAIGDGQDFANRISKNWQKGQKEAQRRQTDAWRLYDADLPEYAMAIDYYQGYLHVQEYAAPKSIDHLKASQRLQQALALLPQVLDIAPERICVKQRQRQKGSSQYQRQAHDRVEVVVQEGPVRVICNLTDYLDTGLFLDHRSTRLWMAKQGAQRFLNLFSYTATASLHLAFAGARTTSVDLSATYLTWAEKNFRLNGLDPKGHEFIQADVVSWLNNLPAHEQYDMIFLDPPTFSNSKRTEDVFDVQRDHVALIEKCMQHLSPEGLLVFSNNFRRFKLDPSLEQSYRVQAQNERSKDFDFKRNVKIHACWHIRPLKA